MSPESSRVDLPTSIAELRDLIRDRKITKELFETSGFQVLWSKIPECIFSNNPEIVWASLSILGRMAAVSKPAERLANPLIAERLSGSLPEVVRLADGDDRYYLAKSLELGNKTRITEIAFQELAIEETAETARRVWASIASASTQSLTDFLTRLNAEIGAAFRSSNLSSDMACRRLRRVIASISDFLATADCDAGEDLGKQLRILYLGHLPKSGPEDRVLRDDAAGDLVVSLKRIIRLNFAARTDPESYKIMGGMRAWWHPASPPEYFESNVKQIARLGVQSLLSFAKQGVMNKPLREALVAASSKQVIQSLTHEFSSNSQAILPDVAYWFINGVDPKGTRSVPAVEAMSDAKLDEYIARLLISLDSPEIQEGVIEQALKDVGDIMPAEGVVFSEAIKRISQIGQWARAIARSRRIELAPRRAMTVAFDPNVHVGTDDLIVESMVYVQAAGAIKKTQGDISVVLIKAEVEQRHG